MIRSEYFLNKALFPAFASAVALYFVRWGIGSESQLFNEITKTLPLLLLSTITWLATGRRFSIMPLAFLFSAAGDWAGERHNFILQIAMFATAHILFISHFARRARFDLTAKIGASLIAASAILLGYTIIPLIERSVEQYACSIYVLLIGTMAISAVAQQSRYRALYTVAALLFIFSDACIAWNRFVEHIPYASIIIMSTYFAAQYIFATLYLKERGA